MKSAEDGDGIILRVAETSGQDTVTSITLPYLRPVQAFATDLVERNRGVLVVRDRSIQVTVPANGIVTIRCRGSRSRLDAM